MRIFCYIIALTYTTSCKMYMYVIYEKFSVRIYLVVFYNMMHMQYQLFNRSENIKCVACFIVTYDMC